MSRGGVRAAVAVFLVGLLFVWLIRPIGNPCPDVDKLPSGSTGSSAPSFAPPLTRSCTYSTPDGTQARRRYVPAIDLVALLLLAGVVGGAIGLAGPGGREPRPERAARQPRATRAEPPQAPADEQPPAPAGEQPQRERDAARRERERAERERARQEREAGRRG